MPTLKLIVHEIETASRWAVYETDSRRPDRTVWVSWLDGPTAPEVVGYYAPTLEAAVLSLAQPPVTTTSK